MCKVPDVISIRYQKLSRKKDIAVFHHKMARSWNWNLTPQMELPYIADFITGHSAQALDIHVGGLKLLN
jgi:hypothetical protein